MLRITIPSTEFWDEAKQEFVYTKAQTLQLEHFQTICSDIFKASGDNADDQSDKSDDCILDCVEDPYIFKRGHAFVLDD